MSRFTTKDLKENVNHYNQRLIGQGVNYWIVEQGRNGYQATDLYNSRNDGSISCQRMIGGGTSREVSQWSETEMYKLLNNKNVKLTRQQAKRLLTIYGVDFKKDFFQESSTRHATILCLYAKLTNYRKPKSANGSTARYFYANLQNKVKI